MLEDRINPIVTHLLISNDPTTNENHVLKLNDQTSCQNKLQNYKAETVQTSILLIMALNFLYVSLGHLRNDKINEELLGELIRFHSENLGRPSCQKSLVIFEIKCCVVPWVDPATHDLVTVKNYE